MTRKWIGMAVASWITVGFSTLAQQTVHTPILMGVGGSHIVDQKQDGRVRHRPLAQEDKTMRIGRELLQAEPVISIRPPPPPPPVGFRARDRERLRDDRDRVRRAAALED